MESACKLRRITYKLKNPNPLFVKWLQEWKDEAERKNAKSKYILAEALDNLKKFPLPLESGQDCVILQGFGKTLCCMLDNKLEEYKKSQKGYCISKLDEQTKHISTLDDCRISNTRHLVINEKGLLNTCIEPIFNEECTSNSNVEIGKISDQKEIPNANNCKLYTPAFRSGPYAILITLFNALQCDATYMFKVDIQTKAQSLCDKSFTKADTGSKYTAWSCMSLLINRGLICKIGNPAKFNLTSEGIAVAENLTKKYAELLTVPENSNVCCDNFITRNEKINQKHKQKDNNSDKSTKTTQRVHPNSIDFETVIFQSNTFETILLVDTQETSGVAKNAYDKTIHELTQCNVQFEIRHLNVGDFAWICRNESKRELVLPYIVERKRMDDFGSSIRDGRFREQKFRLKQCGIQNIIYLIESHGRNEHTGLPMTTLLQAACNTSVQDGFTIKFTDTHRDSIMYLALMSRILKENISNKTLVSCPKENLKKFTFDDDLIALMDFTEFQNTSIKTKHFTVQNMFIKQLIQIKGVSVDKALGIVTKYPTPLNLYRTYQKDSLIGEKLLANTTFGASSKRIGPALSKTIFQLFTSNKYS